ncbi:class I SAM-dependent RNA methyltransferase [Actinomyces minihominis]|uniref:class I SAM-dependent RNA methyltransferase n=1 Tax=Actinomyces minihominis TaxID=2002838 RepID=UPI000C069B09|nr:class I SAM-dependent RNA methyltransferase [Actinomyces minihominis]
MEASQPTIETVTLGKPVHGGACLARSGDGRTLFVRGGLPGETVRIALTSEHKKFAWADVTEVLEPSVHRVPHVWPEAEAEGVGGVELGHVAPSYQREWKSEVLGEQLQRIGGDRVVAQVRAVTGASEDEPLVVVEPTPGDSAGGDLLGRRTRVQLVIDEQGRPGMRRYRSHDVVPLTELPIATGGLKSLKVLEKPAWKKRWTAGERIALEDPNGSAPVLVSSTGVFTGPGTFGPPKSTWIVTAAGRTHSFSVRPGSFWQTHVEAPAVLVEAVLEGAQVRPGDVVVELYAGSGLFSRFIADELEGGQLLTLEGNKSAVKSAGKVLEPEIESGRVQVFQGRIDGKAVAELAEASGSPIDTIILDPPRSGAEKAVVEALCATEASRVVLVSCDPASGARDLSDFVSGGFRIESIRAWDLFPHTHHFEIVTTLVRD